MKATIECPNCREFVTTDCKACISSGSLWHECSEDGEPEVFNVKWRVIENGGIKE